MVAKERFLSSLLLVTVLVITSCREEAINHTCANPIGTDILTINIEALSCFKEDFKGCFEFRLDGDKVYIQSVYITDTDPEEAPLIFDAGPKECLRDVIERPTADWSYALYVEVGHGYVLKMKEQTLGRLFIDSWLKSGNTVTAVNITRQYTY